MTKQSPSASSWMSSGPGAERRILCYDANLMMVEFRFEKDGLGALHNHPHTQTTVVTSGKFQFKIEDETHILEAGDSLIIPSLAQHECICLEGGVLMDAFTPCRDDFLEAHDLPKSQV